MDNYSKYRHLVGDALVFVLNRLPVTVARKDGGFGYFQSMGGVSSMLKAKELEDAICIGWPGIITEDIREQKEIADRLWEEYRCIPIFLTEKEVHEYYAIVSNGILWGLFHGWKFEGPNDILENLEQYWNTYTEVNRKFALVVSQVSSKGTRVWVHDYHLIKVGRMLREKQPSRAVSFFLHIPFPDRTTFSSFPKAKELLEDWLWCQFIGLHTYGRDIINASACFQDLLHLKNESSREDGVIAAKFVSSEGNVTYMDAVGIGIDTEGFEAMMASKAFKAEVKKLCRIYRGKKIALGYGRLDPTKGFVETLLAFKRALEKYPKLVEEHLTFVLVISPSREDTEKYAYLKDEIDRMVERINGQFRTDTWTPVIHFHRSHPQDKLLAYARIADVLLFLSVADGMNISVFEAILGSVKAMVVASERMGAVERLGGGIIVNPRDIEGIADGIYSALAMENQEKLARMDAIRERIRETNMGWWVKRFTKLWQFATERKQNPAKNLGKGRWRDHVLKVFAEATANEEVEMIVVPDSDGTQLDICGNPDEVVMPSAHRKALEILSRSHSVTLILPSGRPMEVLDGWYGGLPVYLGAEHGGFVKRPDETQWTSRDIPNDWIPGIESIFREKEVNIPGLRVEVKSVAIACHYRDVPEEHLEKVHAMKHELSERIKGTEQVIREDNCVVEVIHKRGTKKAFVLETLAARRRNGKNIVLFFLGDGGSDNEMMEEFPEAYNISVGRRLENADYHLDDPAACRELFTEFAKIVRQE